MTGQRKLPRSSELFASVPGYDRYRRSPMHTSTAANGWLASGTGHSIKKWRPAATGRKQPSRSIEIHRHAGVQWPLNLFAESFSGVQV
jgi:hypothetical protein